MPQDIKYPAFLNLDKYDIFLEEKLDNSRYIFIDEMPRVLGYGKHYFLLSWKKNTASPYKIKHSSKMLFELKDDGGNIIFSDITNTLPLNGSAVCYVWVKKNPLRQPGDRWEITDGPCVLSVVYELEGGNISHNELRYGRSTFQYEVKKKIPNTSPILFYSGSQLSGGLSISESLDFDGDDQSPYKRSYLHISNSHMKTGGGKVEFVELSYIETGSAASSSAFKLLTTYKLSASGDYYEVTSSDATGLNPLSHIHKVVTPREIRRDKNVIFKLRYLNSNKEVAKDISENTDISLTYPMYLSGSPFILETNDNLIHSSGSIGFGDSAENSIRLSFTSSAPDGGGKQTGRLSFQEFKNDVFVKEVGQINANKEEYIFGKGATNQIIDSSGSIIIGGGSNYMTGSSTASMVGTSNSSIMSSSRSSILGGNNNKISRPNDPNQNNAGDNVIIGTINGLITGSDSIAVGGARGNALIAGVSNKILIGSENLIVGGLANEIISQSALEDASLPDNNTPQYNVIIGGTYGVIEYGATYSSIISSKGIIAGGGALGNRIGTGSGNPVKGGSIISCENNNFVHHNYSSIIGMSGKTTTAANTVYVQNLEVDGTLTAQEFHTEFTSASIIYESGSTKFGDTMDDIHNITGSVYTTGSLTINTELSASGAELTVEGDISASGTASFGRISLSNSGSTLDFIGHISGSSLSTASAGHFKGDGSGLTGVTGIDIDGLSSLGGTGLHQTQDHFMFSDNGTEKKITFSNLEDAIFAHLGGDVTTAAGGAVSMRAAQTNITSLLATDIKIGEDGETKIDFETANEIHFDVNNVELLNMAGNVVSGSLISTASFGRLTLVDSGSTLDFIGHISGSSTSTGSFGHLMVGDITTNNITASGNVDIDGTLKLGNFSDVSSSLAAAVAGGDNLGNHTATQDLNLGGNDIYGVQHITASGNISASSLELNAVNATDDFFLLKSGSLNTLKVNNEGVLRLGGFTFTPTAVSGGIYYNDTDDEFYLGKNN